MHTRPGPARERLMAVATSTGPPVVPCESDPIDMVVAGARVVDPLERIDETLDVTIESKA